MSAGIMNSAETGLDVVDIAGESVFNSRPVREHDVAAQMEWMQRIARAFVEDPDTILQELVNAAVELCGADSAGISIEREGRTEAEFYHWVATAGQYSKFLNAILPEYPSACGVCLERSQPQHFRVGQKFFDLMGIEAPLVTDGILLPWMVGEMRGTIFVMAHGRAEAFDRHDCRMMEMLADFAAIGIRQQRQQKLLLERASDLAAAALANDLAHQINNPLQSLTNVLFLAGDGHYGEDAKVVGRQALEDLERLSSLANRLLALPYRKIAGGPA